MCAWQILWDILEDGRQLCKVYVDYTEGDENFGILRVIGNANLCEIYCIMLVILNLWMWLLLFFCTFVISYIVSQHLALNCAKTNNADVVVKTL